MLKRTAAAHAGGCVAALRSAIFADGPLPAVTTMCTSAEVAVWASKREVSVSWVVDARHGCGPMRTVLVRQGVECDHETAGVHRWHAAGGRLHDHRILRRIGHARLKL